MSNFIPNETILVRDRDPPWITSKLKRMIQDKNVFYKKNLKPNNQEIKFKTEIGSQLRIPRRSIMKNFQINFGMISLRENVIGQFFSKLFFKGK